MFVQLINVQNALSEINHISQNQNLSEDEFDIDFQTGELLLGFDKNKMIEVNKKVNNTSSGYQNRNLVNHLENGSSSHSGDEFRKTEADISKSIIQIAQGRKTESITLYKADNSSLGFGVVGMQGEGSDSIGIYVQEIQPGGIAAQ